MVRSRLQSLQRQTRHTTSHLLNRIVYTPPHPHLHSDNHTAPEGQNPTVPSPTVCFNMVLCRFSIHLQDANSDIVYYTCETTKTTNPKVLVLDKAARTAENIFVWKDARAVSGNDRYETLLFPMKEDVEGWEEEPLPTDQDWPPRAWRDFFARCRLEPSSVRFHDFLEKQMYLSRSFKFANDPNWFSVDIHTLHHKKLHAESYPVYRHGTTTIMFFHPESGFEDEQHAKKWNALFQGHHEIVWKFGFVDYSQKKTFREQSGDFNVHHVIRNVHATTPGPFPDRFFGLPMLSPLHKDHQGTYTFPFAEAGHNFAESSQYIFNYVYSLWQVWPKETPAALDDVGTQDDLRQQNAQLHAQLQEKDTELERLRALLQSQGVDVL